MISRSRSGARRSDARRVRTSRDQSGTFPSRDGSNGFDEGSPGLPLLRQHPSPFGRDPVEAPAAFGRLFDPAALDPATLLEAIEQGIQGIDVERQLPTRPYVDQLAQLVAVPGPRLEQRQDEQLRGPALQLAVERARVDICHR